MITNVKLYISKIIFIILLLSQFFLFDDCVRKLHITDDNISKETITNNDLNNIIEAENNSIFKTYRFNLEKIIVLKRDLVDTTTKLDDNIIFMLENKNELFHLVGHKSWNGSLVNSIWLLKFDMTGTALSNRKINTSYDFIDVMINYKNKYMFYEFKGINILDMKEFIKNENTNKPLMFTGIKKFKNLKGENDNLDRGYIASDGELLYVVVPSQNRVVAFNIENFVSNALNEDNYSINSYIEIGDKNISYLDNLEDKTLLHKPERIFVNNKFILIPNYRTKENESTKIESISVYDSKTKEFIKIIEGFYTLNYKNVNLRGVHNLDENHTTFCLSISGGDNRMFVFRDRDIRNKDLNTIEPLQEINGLDFKTFHWGTDNIYVDNITKKLYVNNKDTVKVYGII